MVSLNEYGKVNMCTTVCHNHLNNNECCKPVESLLQKGLRERRERIAHLPELARYEYECSGCYRFVWTDGSSQFLSETDTPCRCMGTVQEDIPVPTDEPVQESESTEWWRK